MAQLEQQVETAESLPEKMSFKEKLRDIYDRLINLQTIEQSVDTVSHDVFSSRSRFDRIPLANPYESRRAGLDRELKQWELDCPLYEEVSSEAARSEEEAETVWNTIRSIERKIHEENSENSFAVCKELRGQQIKIATQRLVQIDQEITNFNAVDQEHPASSIAQQAILRLQNESELLQGKKEECMEEYRTHQNAETAKEFETELQKQLSNQNNSPTILNTLSGVLRNAVKTVSSAITQGPSDIYTWSTSSWGLLLLQSDNEKSSYFDFFKTQINDQKTRMRNAETKIHVINSFLEELQNQRNRPLSVEDWRELNDLEKQLEAQRNTLRTEKGETERFMRGGILQRIIDVVSKKQCTINKLNDEMSDIEEIIERNRIYLIFAPSAQIKIDEDTIKLNKLKTQLAGLQADISVLNDAFDKQLYKYCRIPNPQRTFNEFIKDYSIKSAKEILSLGFLKAGYLTSEEFRNRKKLADLGYDPFEAIKNFESLSGDDPGEVVRNLVTEFLDWAESHPKMAEKLSKQITVTLSLLSGDSVVSTLISGVNKISMTKALLGESVRGEEEEIFTEEHLKWQALADFSTYAPMATIAPEVLKKMLQELADGRLIGAVTTSLLTAFTKGARVQAIEKVLNDLPQNQLESIESCLRFWRGDTLGEILQAKTSMNLLRMGGALRRAYTNPQSALLSTQRWFVRNWQILNHAGSVERVLRIGSVTVIPYVSHQVAGLGYSLMMMFGAYGPGSLFSIIAFGGFTIATIGMAGVFVLPPIAYCVIDGLFHKTVKTIDAQYRENVMKTPEIQQQLAQERNSILAKLRKHGSIPGTEPIQRSEMFPAGVDEEALSQEIETAFDKTIEAFNQFDTKMSIKEVVRSFQHFDWHAHIESDNAIVRTYIAECVKQKVSTEWLKDRFLMIIESQFSDYISREELQESELMVAASRKIDEAKDALEGSLNTVVSTNWVASINQLVERLS